MCIAQAIKQLITCSKPGAETFLPYPGYSEAVLQCGWCKLKATTTLGDASEALSGKRQ